MALIRISFAGLEVCESQLSSQIGELNALNDRLTALLQRIGDSWEGEASEAYLSVMRMREQKARLMVGVLEEFREYVQQAEQDFWEQDQSGASMILRSF